MPAVKSPAKAVAALSFAAGLGFVGGRLSAPSAELLEAPPSTQRIEPEPPPNTSVTTSTRAGERVAFVSPEASGHRIDACLRTGQECGRPAADHFCRSAGFARATEFAEARGALSTISMTTGEVCQTEACRAFEMVVCERDK